MLEDAAQLLLGRRHLLALDVQEGLDLVLDGVSASLASPGHEKNTSSGT